MKKEIIDCELSYAKCFCDYVVEPDIIRFSDRAVPDMYDHNFTYIENRMSDRQLMELINHEIVGRNTAHQEFCKISCGFTLDHLFTSLLALSPAIGRLGFYTLSTSCYTGRKGNDNCSILRIDNPKRAEDNVAYDLRLDQERFGEDFCRRRAIASGKVYVNDGGVDSYICYHDDAPVGTCELFLHKDVAKIENFTVLPCEQFKGYGTSLLKHLIHHALKKGAKTIYLVTDEDDTAKEMYRKFGFEKSDESIELLFML